VRARRLPLVSAILLLASLGSLPQDAVPSDGGASIAAHLPKAEILVTSDYHGERLLIYGMASPDTDVVVKLSSKRESVTYSRKGRVGLFWFSVGKVTFTNVPSMFKTKSTKPLDDILFPEEQIKYSLGKRGLIASIGTPDPATPPFLIEEMISTRVEDRLYSFHEGEVKRVKGNMFETSFYWPPKAPPGAYQIDTLAVRGGKVIGVDSELVKVEKVGVEAWVSGLASANGLLYGLIAVVVAMVSGLLVGLIFRGMGPGGKRSFSAH